MVSITVLATVIAAFISPLAAVATLITSVLLMGCSLYLANLRYREIQKLSGYLRQVSRGDYSLDIRDNQEGDLSVLKNDIYKVTLMLSEQGSLLQQEKHRLTEAIADISHQLKTPLTSMMVMADLLRDVNLPEEKRTEFTRKIRMQLERIEWLVSSLLKLKTASNISAIDAIRQTTDIKLTGKGVRTTDLIRTIFGFEAEIGLKNLKRNKRRYRATVFSLVISIVLFLTVSFFTDNLQRSAGLSEEEINFDIQVTLPGENAAEDQQLIKTITGLHDVTEYSVVNDLSVNAWIDEELIAEELREYSSEVVKNGKYPYYINVHALDQKSLQDYAREVGADYTQLRNADKLSGIVIDTISYRDYEAKKFVETKAINTAIGQNIELYHIDPETGEETHLDKLRIAFLTEKSPMGVSPSGLGGLTVIVSEQVMGELVGNGRSADTKIVMKSADPLKTQHQIEEMQESNFYIFNVYQIRQANEQIMLLLSVFTYGFIVLMAAICLANILNTISTSIALRKREFAMLKSVGMTPQGFNKMLNYESLFYGIKSLIYGLPLSVIAMYLIYLSLGYTFSYDFTLPWVNIGYVIIAVFIIVAIAMLYSSSKVRKENIIDAFKQENI
jgi:putative ABC transport system permease protein